MSHYQFHEGGASSMVGEERQIDVALSVLELIKENHPHLSEECNKAIHRRKLFYNRYSNNISSIIKGETPVSALTYKFKRFIKKLITKN